MYAIKIICSERGDLRFLLKDGKLTIKGDCGGKVDCLSCPLVIVKPLPPPGTATKESD